MNKNRINHKFNQPTPGFPQPPRPTGAFRIRTPNSPPSTQHWRHRAAPGADLEMPLDMISLDGH